MRGHGLYAANRFCREQTSLFMIHSLIGAHRLLTYVLGGFLLVLSGYGQARLFPDSPVGACTSWLIAVLWFAFGLAGVKSLGSAGPVVGLLVLTAGLILICRYYLHRRPR
jgi:hypothetical protein